MAGEADIPKLAGSWREGNEQAADQLHRRYWERLYRLVDEQLDRRLRKRVSPEDILQSAFGSFFRRTGEGQYQIDDSGHLWNLLKTITLNKLRKQADRHRAAKRDVGREQSLTQRVSEEEILARGPSPEDAAIFLDELEALAAELSAREQQIVQLCLQGESVATIAETLGCSRWTVRRALRRAEQRLRQRAEGELS
ncbi:MAG: sigma-70 family RNA polymerase sigma factor [Planctomycetes bacterium]|nr:sigma-70 family RNA polymerase sigma factor [Planctomycetota bacterium]